MYTPPKFRMEDPAIISNFFRKHSFGLLLTIKETEIHDTHTPFLIDEEQGSLIGHIARANPQWHSWDASTTAKVIFTGPHAYISPSYYASDFNVPTWNYTAVSVSGKLDVIEKSEEKLAFLDRLTAHYEPQEAPWTLDRNDARYMNLLDGIVVFKVSMDHVAASFKLNQNKTIADQESVIAALYKSGNASDQEVAAMMQKRLQCNCNK